MRDRVFTVEGFSQQNLWSAFAPATAISLVILGFNLLDDGLRDVFDPKLDVR